MVCPTPASDWPESWTLSHHYDRMEVCGDHPRSGYASAYRARRRVTLRMVHRAVGPGATILDLAAAQGNFTLALAEEGYHVTWNDLRAELEGYVRLKWTHGDVRYLPGNILTMDAIQPYDLVIATEVIEHVAHPDVFLTTLATLVKPGGYVILTTPNGEYCRNQLPRFSDCADPSVFESAQFKPDADGHIFLLHQDEIRHLAHAAGLRLLELDYYASLLTAGHLGLSRILTGLPPQLIDRAESVAAGLPEFMQRRLLAGCAVLLTRP